MAQVFMNIFSRKLLSIWGGMVTISGLWIGMAVVDTSLPVELAPQLVEVSVLIAGLAGYNAYRQGAIDEANGGDVDEYEAPTMDVPPSVQ